jgi:Ca2+/Na+ antiporter
MFQSESGARLVAETVLIVGVTVLYVATRLALSSWARLDGTAPRRRAVAQWLPILATTAAALALREPAVAIGLIFGTSIACLSLVLGLSSYIAPLQELPPDRRVWPLVLPASLLVLLIGFRGNFTWVHALMLMAMGATFLGVWMERPGADGGPPLAVPTESPSNHVGLTMLAVVLAIVGGWAAVKGAIQTGEHSRMISAPLMATAVLSPLMMLPALGSATIAAHRGQIGNVITSLCGTVQLNLCALLPAVILIDALGGTVLHLSNATAVAATGGALPATPFPLVTWRVDAVVLVLLAFSLIPVASGRWLPDRLESMLLIVVYAAYLVAETALSARLIL